MANYYLQFSEEISSLTPPEIEWLRAEVAKFDPDDCQPFDCELQGSEFWLYAEETGNPDETAEFIQRFLQQFRPNACFALTWATTCSKPRLDAFGGGAMFITAQKIQCFNVGDWVNQCKVAWKRGSN